MYHKSTLFAHDDWIFTRQDLIHYYCSMAPMGLKKASKNQNLYEVPHYINTFYDFDAHDE